MSIRKFGFLANNFVKYGLTAILNLPQSAHFQESIASGAYPALPR
jgi:hypothetical protein